MSAGAAMSACGAARRIPMSPAIGALLARCGLDASDLGGADEPCRILAFGAEDAPSAVVALEGRGPDLLLRSLAVEPARRGRGCAESLVTAVEALARDEGARTLWLLTETAEAFFARRGYEAVERGAAPAAIRATRQFSELCPDAATLMHKPLAEQQP